LSAPAPGPETATRTVKPGWNGRFFEDYAAGDGFKHVLSRTITATDNAWFTYLVPAQIGEDVLRNVGHVLSGDERNGEGRVDQRLAEARLSCVIGVEMQRRRVLGEQRLPHPVFEGDTLYSETEVLDVRESKSRPEVGAVTVTTIGHNQNGDIVIAFERTLLVYRRGHGPSGRHRPEPRIPTPP
jgi:itaconyl-CoA hydratase